MLHKHVNAHVSAIQENFDKLVSRGIAVVQGVGELIGYVIAEHAFVAVVCD